jgi:hypothetical protein
VLRRASTNQLLGFSRLRGGVYEFCFEEVVCPLQQTPCVACVVAVAVLLAFSILVLAAHVVGVRWLVGRARWRRAQTQRHLAGAVVSGGHDSLGCDLLCAVVTLGTSWLANTRALCVLIRRQQAARRRRMVFEACVADLRI